MLIMQESDHFDQLVSDLSVDERKGLLEKLKGLSNLVADPLFADEDEPSDSRMTANEQFFSLPWYSRIGFYIQGFFRRKSPVKLYEDRQIIQMGKQIDALTPGLYDYKTGKLLPVFYLLLNNLKSASRFFYSALNSGFNRDKGAFFAFLGSLEMTSVHSQLQSAVNPVYHEEKNPAASESWIRQAMLHSIDDALGGITEKFRASMYFNTRSLFCLKELAFFPYDRLVMAFSLDNAQNGYICSVNAIRELLLSLFNILASLKYNPQLTLLESLFIFQLQERSGEPGFDFNREIRALLTNAEDALATIRDFNKRVPLVKILQCSSRNAPVYRKAITGGEDWHAAYRDYWRNLAEHNHTVYAYERNKKAIMGSMQAFFEGDKIYYLMNAASDTRPDGFPVNKTFSLSFLLTFYSIVLSSTVSKTLKTILIDCDFSRKENRIEFNECYSILSKMEEEIGKFDDRISPNGDFGKRYQQAKQDVSALAVKRKKIQIVVDEAADDAAGIIEEIRRALKGMINLLGGILGKTTRSKYSPLVNVSRVMEKNSGFLVQVNDAVGKFKNALRILDDIDNLE